MNRRIGFLSLIAALSLWGRGWSLPPSLVRGDAYCFVENRGQWRGDFRYRAQVGDVSLFLREKGWILVKEELQGLPENWGDLEGIDRFRALREAQVKGVSLWFRFVGAREKPILRGEDVLSGKCHFFLGKDPSRWKTNLSRYGSVRAQGLYPGTDLVFHAGPEGLEFDLFLTGPSRLGEVVIQVEGGLGIRVDEKGDLRIGTELGEIRLPSPYALDGEGKKVRIAYEVLGKDRFGFKVVGPCRPGPLWVDPKVEFSTYLGGSRYYLGGGRAHWGPKGNLYVAGSSGSTFPTTPGAFQVKSAGQWEGFLTCLDPTGRKLVFSTFLGGRDSDGITDFCFGPNGEVYCVGSTWSIDFPTTPGSWDRVFGNNGVPSIYSDGVLVCLSNNGSVLSFGTYLGGQWDDWIPSVVLVKKIGILCCVNTNSFDYPTTPGAWRRLYIGGYNDVALTCLNLKGSKVLASTFFGGTGEDRSYEMVLGPRGKVWTCGSTSSKDFYTTQGAFRGKFGGGHWDGFVAEFDPSTLRPLASTYLGGKENDYAWGVRVNGGGDVFVAGRTSSRDFPVTPGVWETVCKVGSSAFVSRLDSKLSKVIASTFLGGNTFVRCYCLDLDPSGCPLIVGDTGMMQGLPVTPDAFDKELKAAPGHPTWLFDAFVSRLDPRLRRLLYSSFIGGSAKEEARAVTVNQRFQAAVFGGTDSKDFPVTPGAFQTKIPNQTPPFLFHYLSGFVTCLNLRAKGVRRVGEGSPSCQGWPTLYLRADPVAGAKGFGLEVWRVPPKWGGWIFLGMRVLPKGIPFFGAVFQLDPSRFLAAIPLISDKEGRAGVDMALPPALRGLTFAAQGIWPHSPTCRGKGYFCSTDALEITVQ